MPERFEIEVDADTAGFRRELNRAGDAVDGLEKDFAAAGSEARKFERAQTSLGTEVGKTGRAAGNASASGGPLSRLGGSFSDAGGKATGLKGNLGAIGTSLSGFAAAAGPAALAAAAVAGLGIAFSKMTEFIAGSIEEFGEFETAVARLAVLGEEGDVGSDILQLANDLDASAETLAGLRYEAISAGIDDLLIDEAIVTSHKAAEGTLGDVDEILGTVATTLNSYGDEIDNVEQITDKLIATEKAARITTGDLGEELGGVIGVAKNAGLSFDDLLASIGGVTLQGVDPNQATTQVRALIASLSAPLPEAIKIFEDFGVEVGAARIESDGFLPVVQDVYNAFKDPENQTALRQAVGSSEALQAALALGADDGANFKTVQEGLAEAAGLTDLAFQAQDTTLSASQEKLSNSFETLQTLIGEQLAPALAPIYTELTNLLGDINQWFLDNKPVVEAWGMVLGEVVGTVISAVKGFIDTALLPLRTAFNLVRGIGGALGLIDADAGEAFAQIGEDFGSAVENVGEALGGAIDVGSSFQTAVVETLNDPTIPMAAAEAGEAIGGALSGGITDEVETIELEPAVRPALRGLGDAAGTSGKDVGSSLVSGIEEELSLAELDVPDVGVEISGDVTEAFTAAVEAVDFEPLALPLQQAADAIDTSLDDFVRDVPSALEIAPVEPTQIGNIPSAPDPVAVETAKLAIMSAYDEAEVEAEFTDNTLAALADFNDSITNTDTGVLSLKDALNAAGSAILGLDNLTAALEGGAFDDFAQVFGGVADGLDLLTGAMEDGILSQEELINGLASLGGIIGGAEGAGLQGAVGAFQTAESITDALEGLIGDFEVFGISVSDAINVGSAIAGGVAGFLGFGGQEETPEQAAQRIALEVQSSVLEGFLGLSGDIAGIIGNAVADGFGGARAREGVAEFLRNSVRSQIAESATGALLDPILSDLGAAALDFGLMAGDVASGAITGFNFGFVADEFARDFEEALQQAEGLENALSVVFRRLGLEEAGEAGEEAGEEFVEGVDRGVMQLDPGGDDRGLFMGAAQGAMEQGEMAGEEFAEGFSEGVETGLGDVEVENALVASFRSAAGQVSGVIGDAVAEGMTGAEAAQGVENFVNNLIRTTVASEVGTALLQPILESIGTAVDQGLETRAETGVFDTTELTGLVEQSGQVAQDVAAILGPIFDAFQIVTDQEDDQPTGDPGRVDRGGGEEVVQGVAATVEQINATNEKLDTTNERLGIQNAQLIDSLERLTEIRDNVMGMRETQGGYFLLAAPFLDRITQATEATRTASEGSATAIGGLTLFATGYLDRITVATEASKTANEASQVALGGLTLFATGYLDRIATATEASNTTLGGHALFSGTTLSAIQSGIDLSAAALGEIRDTTQSAFFNPPPWSDWDPVLPWANWGTELPWANWTNPPIINVTVLENGETVSDIQNQG